MGSRSSSSAATTAEETNFVASSENMEGANVSNLGDGATQTVNRSDSYMELDYNYDSNYENQTEVNLSAVDDHSVVDDHSTHYTTDHGAVESALNLGEAVLDLNDHTVTTAFEFARSTHDSNTSTLMDTMKEAGDFLSRVLDTNSDAMVGNNAMVVSALDMNKEVFNRALELIDNGSDRAVDEINQAYSTANQLAEPIDYTKAGILLAATVIGVTLINKMRG